MKKFFQKIGGFFCAIGRWFKNHMPTRRRIIQLYAALLTNANLKGFVTGRIYQLTLEYDPAAKWWTARTRNGPRAIWCPYASPEAFLANWSPLEATVTVKRRL